MFEPVIFLNSFPFGYSYFIIVLWLEIHDVFFRFYSLVICMATSAVTAYNVDVLR